MAQEILLKRTAVVGKTPTTDNLATGELAINIADGKIFLKKETAGVAEVVEVGFVTFNGDVTGSGIKNINLTLANSGITAGTYTKLTVDAKGRSISGSQLSASDIPNLNWSQITAGKPTSIDGYGITDAIQKNPDISEGTFTKLTVDTKGLVVSGSQLQPSDIPELDASKITSGELTIPVNANSETASKLQTPRNISITGDLSWSVNFDGSESVSANSELISTGIIPGSYTKVEVDEKGRVLSGTNPFTLSDFGIIDAVEANDEIVAGEFTKIQVDEKGLVVLGSQLSASDIPNLDWGKITSGKPTSLSGYGITDAINSSIIGQANGVPPLDANAKIPATFLPSFVDDVIESIDFASLPEDGETGKIYVTIDNDKTYRWSGSTYVEISASPGSTDAVTEGSVNLYFTPARAQAAVTSVTGNAGTATVLENARNISITGDMSWNVSFNGSQDVIGNGTLSNTGISAGTYTKLTIDAKGRATSGASLIASDIPNLDWGKITSGKPTSVDGYGISDGPRVNPSTPRNGDIRTVGAVISIYADGNWRQIFPAVYS